MTTHIFNVMLIPTSLDGYSKGNEPIQLKAWNNFVGMLDHSHVMLDDLYGIREALKQFDAVFVGTYLHGTPDEVLFFSPGGYAAFLLIHGGGVVP